LHLTSDMHTTQSNEKERPGFKTAKKTP